MNPHESAGEERTGGFEGRAGGAELAGDGQQVGVQILKGGVAWGWGGNNRLLVARVNGHSGGAAGHHLSHELEAIHEGSRGYHL